MRAVVQRVTDAQATLDGEPLCGVGNGIVVMLGVSRTDTFAIAENLWVKILNLPLFEDENGRTSLTVADVQGEVLILSQFTLYADCRGKNPGRPSYARAAEPMEAQPVFDHFVECARSSVPCVETGVYGAHMQVDVGNDGPFTVQLDSEELWPGTRRIGARPSASARAGRGRTGGGAGYPLVTVIVAALVAAVVAGLVVGYALSSATSEEDDGSSLASALSYDWSYLQQVSDRLFYYGTDGTLLSQVGVDVSDHQGEIDWEAVAADGIDFAMVRLGYRGYTAGYLYEDAYAVANLDGAAAAGLEVGAYFFSQATTVEEAIEEAEFVLEILDGRELDLPIAFDHETVSSTTGRANDIDGEELAAIAIAFCETLEAAGYDTIIYGNATDLARFDGESFGARNVWLAEYTYDGPTTQIDFIMWQYTNTGTVDGIEVEVDLNLLFTVE